MAQWVGYWGTWDRGQGHWSLEKEGCTTQRTETGDQEWTETDTQREDGQGNNRRNEEKEKATRHSPAHSRAATEPGSESRRDEMMIYSEDVKQERIRT